MEKSRKKLLKIDKKIIQLLGDRMKISQEIGNYKKQNKIEHKQTKYWKETEIIRNNWATEQNVEQNFIKKLFNAIRRESLRIQKK
ncbi:MAG: chorismate mutase [Bacteroidetes bacterium]|nr:chorismate mutase [Bacteroidota bacterium]